MASEWPEGGFKMADILHIVLENAQIMPDDNNDLRTITPFPTFIRLRPVLLLGKMPLTSSLT